MQGTFFPFGRLRTQSASKTEESEVVEGD